jgi:hypothetical protein
MVAVSAGVAGPVVLRADAVSEDGETSSVPVAYDPRHGLCARFRDGWFECEVCQEYCDDHEASFWCDTTLGGAAVYLGWDELDRVPMRAVDLAE